MLSSEGGLLLGARPTAQPLAITISHQATAATPLSFHKAKNTTCPQHKGEYSSPGVL